jgi:hypothetical protein
MMSFLKKTRNFLFRNWNQFWFRGLVIRDGMDSVIIVVIIPGLAHLAVPAVNLLGSGRPVILIDNGLSGFEGDWLREVMRGRPILRMRTSRFWGDQMVASHGLVMETFTGLAKCATIFMDADCYPFSDQLIVRMLSGWENRFLATPFWYANEDLQMAVPDTFLLGVNTELFHILQDHFDVGFGVSSALPDSLEEKATQRWGSPIPFPHPWKSYFDTVHTLAIAGTIQGFNIECLPTEIGDVYHVCGTSYSQTSLQPPADANELFLNAHYFHMRMVEEWGLHWLTQSFESMINHYGGSTGLIRSHPYYNNSHQRICMDELVAKLLARQTFRDGSL